MTKSFPFYSHILWKMKRRMELGLRPRDFCGGERPSQQVSSDEVDREGLERTHQSICAINQSLGWGPLAESAIST
jgi:hypothetical protein